MPLNEKHVQDIDSTINSSILYERYINGIILGDKSIRKMIENSENYYIIYKEENIILGPFTEFDFIKEKQKKGINLDF